MSLEVGFTLGLPKIVLVKTEEPEVEEMPFRCDVCQRTFSSLGFLKAHFQRTHSNTTFPSQLPSKPKSEIGNKLGEPEVEEMPFRCYVCERTFSRIGFLKAHFQRAHPNSTFPSELYSSKRTSETVNRKPNSVMFTKSDSQSQSLVCEVCKKSFVKKIDLLKHSFVHYRFPKSGFFPTASCHAYSCDLCSLCFSSRSLYRKHYFKCELCSNDHCKSWLLQKVSCSKEDCKICLRDLCEKCHQLHLACDVKEKVHSCFVCDRKFVGKRNLNDHYAIVHSITKLAF